MKKKNNKTLKRKEMTVDVSKVVNVVIVNEKEIVDRFLLRGAIFDKSTGTLTLKRQPVEKKEEKISPVEVSQEEK